MMDTRDEEFDEEEFDRITENTERCVFLLEEEEYTVYFTKIPKT